MRLISRERWKRRERAQCQRAANAMSLRSTSGASSSSRLDTEVLLDAPNLHKKTNHNTLHWRSRLGWGEEIVHAASIHELP